MMVFELGAAKLVFSQRVILERFPIHGHAREDGVSGLDQRGLIRAKDHDSGHGALLLLI